MRVIGAGCFAVQHHDGHVMAVSNTQPEGIALAQFHSLLPGELAWRYKRGSLAWEQFRHQYLAQLRANTPAIMAELGDLRRTEHDTLTLCCWEPDPRDCHRSWVAQFLSDFGLECDVH